MKTYVYLILILLSATASCQTNTVLICLGSSSYAYHDHHCEGLNRCHAKIENVSLAKARSLGRIPCRYCYHTAAPGARQPVVQPALQPAKQNQCTAITKKGTRCSRTARSNGRCWQHGG